MDLCLLTGASSGIGFEIARGLMSSFDLLLVSKDPGRLARAEEELNKEKIEKERTSSHKGGRILSFPCDVSDPKAVEDLKAFTLRELMVPAIIVNAAGFGTIGYFSELPAERELSETRTNCLGVLSVMKAFLPLMEKEGGYILNVASSAAMMPGSPGMAVYYATKAFVLSLTRSVNAEEREKKTGLFLGALCPGPVRTAFSEKAGGKGEIRGYSISAGTCAREAIRGIRKKKEIIVPGRLMRIGLYFSRILPARALLYLAGRHQKEKGGLT